MILPQPVVDARSAILFEQSTGTIIFNKGPELKIAPASLTKLVVIALVLEHLQMGGIPSDTEVIVGPNAWAVNAPPRSSLMFLDGQQNPTWNELLLGLAVSSGNDAATAVAEAISGSVSRFVSRMNEYVASIGLKETHFVEPSGYSEDNVTTAADFAYFVSVYLNRFPQVTSVLHNVKSFSYPTKDGLPPIRQYNRNQLLSLYPGVDGLKTGFIDESGYNLAFTAARNGQRLVGIILGAQNEIERTNDAIRLLDFGFGNYTIVEMPSTQPLSIRVWKGSPNRIRVESGTVRVLLPSVITGNLKEKVSTLDEIIAPLRKNTVVGEQLWLTESGTTVIRIPLTAGMDVSESNFIITAAEHLYLSFRTLLGETWPRPYFNIGQ